MSIVKYKHHGKNVFVREDLKGKHRDYCLCFRCNRFKEDRSKNCNISNIVYETCVKYNLVSPVWECPEFDEKGKCPTCNGTGRVEAKIPTYAIPDVNNCSFKEDCPDCK